MEEKQDFRKEYPGFISGNALKLIACASMLIDHIGMLFFPSLVFLRAVGRIAMPLFAFTAAEGFYYTKNKLLHFIVMLALGICVSTVFSIAENRPHFDILITFSLSSLIVYAIDGIKRHAFAHNKTNVAASVFACALAVALAVFLCLNAHVEYGLAGVFLPVAVRLPDFRRYGAGGILAAADNSAIRLACFTAGLIALSFQQGSIQWLCLFALPFVAAYNGKRGIMRLKYFFYIFYIGHFAVLGAIYATLHPEVIQLILSAL